MKKIISLIASLSLVATMVAPVYAAEMANNAPVVESTMIEHSADEFYTLSKLTLEEGQKGYSVDVTASGFDLLSVADNEDDGMMRSGLMVTAAEYKMTFDDESKIVKVKATNKGTCRAASGKAYCNMNKTSAAEAYPQADDDDTVGVTATTMYINTFYIVTSGEVTADITAEFVIVPFKDDVAGEQKVFRNDQSNISYTVNGVAGNTITFGEEEEELADIVIGTRKDLDDGFAWDVDFKYDTSKKYTAKFTDVNEADESKKTKIHDLDFSNLVEWVNGARYSFVTLLKTERTDVTLVIE